MSEWNVYYNSFSYSDMERANDKESGTEIPINKDFTWGAEEWKILSMCFFDQGPVFHICKRIKNEVIGDFYAKWGYLMQTAKEGLRDEISMAELNMMHDDSPYAETPSINIAFDGEPIESDSSMSNAWIPLCYDNPEFCKNMPHILSHYSLDDSDGWLIIHVKGRWPADFVDVKNISEIEITLEADATNVDGPHFSIKEKGAEVEFTRPLTGQRYTLKVLSCEPGTLDDDEEDGQWVDPSHYIQLTYTLVPELTEDIFSVKDCSNDDPSRYIGEGRGGLGSVALVLSSSDEGDDSVHTAFSSIYFDPPENVEWRMVFHEKIKEDFTLTLQAGRDFVTI